MESQFFITRIPDLCAMAAKKTTSKPAPSKGKAKPAVKSAKSATAEKKTVDKTKAKAAAPKKAAVAKKVVATKKTAAPKKATPAAKESKPAKSAAAKSRASVVEIPVSPAPEKTAFVPAKPASKGGKTGSNGSNGSNGSHHSASFIQKQRQRLLDLRDELVDAMSGMTRDTIRNAPEGSEASGSGQHQGDAGSDAYDRDFALSVLAKEQDALYEIEQALRRIQLGLYGICEISSNKIPTARLEAIPFARLTVECQAQWEKEYGKRRFRPSNEVGFSGGNYGDDEDSETVSLDEDDE